MEENMITMSKPFLFATDVDGTLMNHDKILGKSNKEELIKLSKNPNFNLLVVTGRSYGELYKILPQLPSEINHYFVGAANGAYLFEIKDGERIDHKVIPLLNPDKVFKHYINLYHAWGNVSTKLETFVSRYYSDLFKTTTLDKHVVKDAILKINGVLKDDYKDSPDYHELKELEKKELLTVYVHDSKAPFLELTSHDAKKVNAIEDVMKLKGIAKDQVIVAGDSTNDIEMINAFNHSFVMRNGIIWEKVNQDRATWLKSTNEDGYITEILAHIS